MALLNWQIVNETALQCVADKPSTIAREASEVVGCYSRQVSSRGLLQARLWEFRPDEERPHAFIYYKLSSPLPDRNQEVSTTRILFFFSYHFTLIFDPFTLFTATLTKNANRMLNYTLHKSASYFCWYYGTSIINDNASSNGEITESVKIKCFATYALCFLLHMCIWYVLTYTRLLIYLKK